MSNRNEGHGSAPSTRWRPADQRALTMSLLGGLFFLRVIGQVLVTYARVGWLPSVEHWQSGLLPYRVLLAFQGAILGMMGAMITGVWRGRGRFYRRRPRLGRAIRSFGWLYLTSMVVRYAVTMTLRPQWRWFGHTIPIIFHGILATYLVVYSGVLIDKKRSASAESAVESAGTGHPESRTVEGSTR